jgi:hypothetical protein
MHCAERTSPWKPSKNVDFERTTMRQRKTVVIACNNAKCMLPPFREMAVFSMIAAFVLVNMVYEKFHSLRCPRTFVSHTHTHTPPRKSFSGVNTQILLTQL